MASVESLPRSYLRDAAGSAEAIHEMFPSLKFNIKQCTYLGDKLRVVIDSARLFLEESENNEVGTSSREHNTDYVKTFELLVVLGKQIESFVKGCCETKWIQAAMVLTNTSEYVSSLGFNMNLCKVAFMKDHVALKCHTMDEVDGMKKCDAEGVKVGASMDAENLIEKVTLALNVLQGEDRDLASYLLQRLLEIKRAPSSSPSGTYLSDLFAWLKSGKQVGRGASATVYKAKWLGIRVAMKTFEGFENVEFDKEVKTLARLCHPNITSMFCCTKNKRNCSIIMELMDGDLGQLINKRWHDNDGDWRPFPIVEAVDIMLQIGEGVNYLHNEGIVHRDLKSGNILYKGMKVKNVATEYVHVKVADFGISKARDTNTTYSDLTCNTGTNRWMPPEVIRLLDRNQGILRSSTIRVPRYPFKLDTYSFGLVCYEILSGNIPFREWGNPIEVKKRILKKERPRLPSECPLMLKVLIEKCWSHEPESRPTFGEICRELTYIKYSLMTGGSMNQHDVNDSRTRENIADGKVAIHEKGSARSVGATDRSWGWGKGRAGGGRPKPVLRSVSLSLLGEPLVDIRQTYTFKHELGRGERGVTYLCTHNDTGEELACKSIAKQKLTSVDVEDLKREVQIMHHLSGTPNIVELKGAYEDEHLVHLVMELCTGGELLNDIIAKGHYSERAAAKLCRVIVGVVLKLHSLGVFHRGLTPENFLLATKTKDATLKVRGFKLATFFEHGELFREIVGSPYYMAPEVLKRSYGPEADVWSAGVILYILLCGVPPFWAETEQGIAVAILRGRIAFESNPWPKISCGAKDLVTRMLNPDREARLTVQQVLDHPWMEAYCDDASDEPPYSVMLTRLIDFSEARKRKLLQQNLRRKEASEEARLLHHVTKT